MNKQEKNAYEMLLNGMEFFYKDVIMTIQLVGQDFFKPKGHISTIPKEAI